MLVWTESNSSDVKLQMVDFTMFTSSVFKQMCHLLFMDNSASKPEYIIPFNNFQSDPISVFHRTLYKDIINIFTGWNSLSSETHFPLHNLVATFSNPNDSVQIIINIENLYIAFDHMRFFHKTLQFINFSYEELIIHR